MSVSIFISYSHQDTDLVKPVVGLLRATKDLVFQDFDSIKPGRRWREQIEQALHAAHLVVLFWCYHSSRSTEVRKEYEFALSTGKDMLPVLLDATPLPKELDEFQWVDFRGLVGLHRSPKHRILMAVLAVLMVALLLSIIYIRFSSFFGGPKPGPDPLYLQLVIYSVWVLGLTLFVVATVVNWIDYRQRTKVPSSDYQKKMAETLQEAFFRRGIGAT
jgi:TIR domain